MSRTDRIVNRRTGALPTKWDKSCAEREWKLVEWAEIYSRSIDGTVSREVLQRRDMVGHGLVRRDANGRTVVEPATGHHRHGAGWWARKMADLAEKRRKEAAKKRGDVGLHRKTGAARLVSRAAALIVGAGS